MTSVKDYKVDFGKAARTILYEDPSGTILFTFDVKPQQDPKTGKWTMVLYGEPYIPGNANPSPERVKLAFSRVKDYVTSKGYDVALS